MTDRLGLLLTGSTYSVLFFVFFSFGVGLPDDSLHYPEKIDVNVKAFGVPFLTEKLCNEQYNKLMELTLVIAENHDVRDENKLKQLEWGENCYWITNGLKMILDLDSIDDAVNNGFTDEDKIRDGCYANKKASVCYGQQWIDTHKYYFEYGEYPPTNPTFPTVKIGNKAIEWDVNKVCDYFVPKGDDCV